SAALKICFSAIPFPPRNGQQELDAGLVGHSRQLQIVFPGSIPTLWDSCDRHAAGAIGREDAQLKLVGVEHGRPRIFPGSRHDFPSLKSCGSESKRRIIRGAPVETKRWTPRMPGHRVPMDIAKEKW